MSRFPDRLMLWAVGIAPEHRREWAKAMAAELDHVRGEWLRWEWSVGCAWSLVRESLTASLRSMLNTSGVEEQAMRRFSLASAALCLVAFLALLVSPMFRQALRLGGDAWMNRELMTRSQIQAIVSEAREHKDAELLAWAAMRYENPERLENAIEAVALDQQYTWIYYTVCEPPMKEHDAECQPMIEALKQWAPDNAIPWLMEASLARPRYAYPPKDAPPTDPRWVAAMDRAFSSSQYDSYRSRRVQLEKSIYTRGYIASPVLLAEGVFTQPVPNFSDLHWQARRLKTGDPGKISAFASVMHRGAQSEVEEIFANGLVGAQRGDRLILKPSRTGQIAFSEVSALIIQYSILALVLGIVLVIAALGAKVAHGMMRGNWLSVEFTEICGVVGATMAGLSSLAIYIAYLPYSKVLESFLQAPERSIDERSLGVFFALSDFAFWRGRHDQMMTYVWLSVVVLGTISLAWMVGRRGLSRS